VFLPGTSEIQQAYDRSSDSARLRDKVYILTSRSLL